MAKLNLLSPWVIYYHEITALFRYDSDIRIIYDEENLELKLYVENEEKATALSILLPAVKTFGKVKLKITVVPANIDFTIPTFEEGKVPALADLYEDLFYDNPVVSFTHRVAEIYYPEMFFIVFKKEVVQYYTDNLSDIYGVHSTLYQEIAKNVFDRVDGIYFCTDVNEENSKIKLSPLGEWP